MTKIGMTENCHNRASEMTAYCSTLLSDQESLLDMRETDVLLSYALLFGSV